MDFATIHQAEIALMKQLQVIRSPFLDQLIIPMSWFDTMACFILFISAVWYAYDRKMGIRLFFLTMIGILVNQDCKILFGQPRPGAFAPELALIPVSWNGFPSGGAQLTLMIVGFLACSIKKRWFSYCALAYLLLVSFSRIYLGAHFPTDVLGGWVIGAITLYLYMKLEPAVEQFLLSKTKWMQFGALLFGAALFTLLSCTSGAAAAGQIALGGGLGLLCKSKLQIPKGLLKKGLYVAVAYFGYFFLAAFRGIPGVEVVGGFWLGYGASFVLERATKLWAKK